MKRSRSILKSLYGKLAVALLVLLCLGAVLHTALALFSTRMYLQEVTQKFNRSLAKNLVSEKILMREGQVDEQALHEVFHMLMVINPSIEVYLLDPEGSVLAFSAPPGKVKRTTVSLEPVRSFLAGTAVLPLLGDDPRHPDRKKVFSTWPIESGGTVQGFLYIILGGEEFESAARMLQGSYILRLSTWAGAGILLVTALAGLILFKYLTQRLRNLIASMEAFRTSDSDQVLDPSIGARPHQDGDDIDQLGTTFAQMADRISKQMEELKQSDRIRRELVANVSHDLRTPLTSLQGYLDTLLLKEGTLTQGERRHYLEIAAKHSERLGKRVSELFELTKLETQETRPHLEPFSLGELIQDVAQKFDLVARKKKVSLKIGARKRLPFIRADIGLIERVLENLIENALRFTPEGGTVTVDLSRTNGTVTVQVTDTGCGIPPEDLPYIFDRFYRVRDSQPMRSDGSGLGLAIAKRILDLHGSQIEAASAINQGTTFTFQLPIFPP